ncbi:MAG TPA: diguanylate cyclase, partial [Cellvibrionaceae bacterium]|nr:diguanylate cyclase [Cellvibrionaceae bacterium]
MASADEFLNEFHWVMDVLQNIDVGLVVLDEEFNVQLWNSFMQNHSARSPSDVLGKKIFELFPELPEAWFRRKVQSVSLLRNSAFTTWEQRPYLFRFKNYRPVTGRAEFMYQNSTIIPLSDVKGKIGHTCIILYDVTEIATNRLQLQRANHQLHIISRTDGLTGLLNHRSFQERLRLELRRAAHGHATLALLMLDVDHFKIFNDTYGHPSGDELLRAISGAMRGAVRGSDTVARYGGEEFAVLLPGVSLEQAALVAEKVRAAVGRASAVVDGQARSATVSIGVALWPEHAVTPGDLVERADRALYEAKRAGR